MPVRSKSVVPISKKREHQGVDARPGNPPTRRRAVLARQLQATGRGRPQLAGRGGDRTEVVRGHGLDNIVAQTHRPVGAEEFGKAEMVECRRVRRPGSPEGGNRRTRCAGRAGTPKPGSGVLSGLGWGGECRRSDQSLDFFGRRAMAARPARPLPKSSMIAGSGAGIRSEEVTSRSTGLTPPG